MPASDASSVCNPTPTSKTRHKGSNIRQPCEGRGDLRDWRSESRATLPNPGPAQQGKGRQGGREVKAGGTPGGGWTARSRQSPWAPCRWKGDVLLASPGNRTHLSAKTKNARAEPWHPWSAPERRRVQGSLTAGYAGQPACDPPSMAQAPCFQPGVQSHMGRRSTWIHRSVDSRVYVHPHTPKK